MTRGITLLSTALVSLALALPAAGAEGRALKGVVVSVSPDAVAVKDAKGVVTTCARADRSPSLDGVAVGDRVQAACARVHGQLVLVKIRRLRTADGTSADDTAPTTFGGVVTALTDGSITVHDGDRDLTCSLGAGSPPTDGVKVGQHVKIACAKGALVAVAPVAAGEPGRAYEGTVSAVDAGSVSVHTDHGVATCTVADGSPSLADVKVGDRVLAGCKAGSNQLVFLKKLPPTGGDDGAAADPHAPVGGAPGPGDQHHVTTVGGMLSAVSDTSVTVHSGEKGDVTCAVAPASPRLGDFHVGDHVGMACVDGVVAKLVRL